MRYLWIIFCALFIISLFSILFFIVCKQKTKEKEKKDFKIKLCDGLQKTGRKFSNWSKKAWYKISKWKSVKNFYTEIFKASLYAIISVIILTFFYSIGKDYYKKISGDECDANISKTVSYFIPKSFYHSCFTLKIDSFNLVAVKDTFNFKCKGIDTTKSLIFVINVIDNDSLNNSKKNTTSKTNQKAVNLNPQDNKNKDKILEDTSNIIGHTSNLLTYITIFFALIGILGGIGIYKYLTTINNLERETEKLKNKTLDAGLATIAAVPLVEATQITSDEYNLAIETITNSIAENRESIKDNPKYSKLLIVEALHYWNLRDYGQVTKILKDALKLAYRGGDDNTIKTINYHLARVYKQWGYELLTNKKREKIGEDYLISANEYAKNTFPQQTKVINLSIESILFHNNRDNNKEDLINALKECIGIDNNFSTNDKITDFASWTAFTVGALIEDEIMSDEVKKYYAQQSLLIFESKINSLEGTNIKTAWYSTMFKLSKNNIYNTLYEFYKNQAKEKNLKNVKLKIFDSILLIEK